MSRGRAVTTFESQLHWNALEASHCRPAGHNPSSAKVCFFFPGCQLGRQVLHNNVMLMLRQTSKWTMSVVFRTVTVTSPIHARDLPKTWYDCRNETSRASTAHGAFNWELSCCSGQHNGNKVLVSLRHPFPVAIRWLDSPLNWVAPVLLHIKMPSPGRCWVAVPVYRNYGMSVSVGFDSARCRNGNCS